MKKKILLFLFALITTVASWAQDVTYINSNGVQATLANGDYTVYSNQTTLNSGWYVVNSDATISDRITVNGVVHLVLMDGVTLNANSGLCVSSGNKLFIYSQIGGTGTLNAAANSVNESGIGGNIHGTAGDIIVNGGHIVAKGGRYASGIGGGGNGNWAGAYGHAGSFTINGGHVDATGGNDGGAGIGGGGYAANSNIRGGNGGVVTINGGSIVARGGSNGYGVGPGTSGWNTGRDGNPAALTLDWRDQNDSIYMANVKADVTLKNVFVFKATGETVTEQDNLDNKTIIPANSATHTVTFMVDNEVYLSRKVIDGRAVNEPEHPIVPTKSFDYWYAEGTSGPYDFSTPVTSDLTLIAQFSDINIDFVDGVYQIGSEENWSTFAEIVLNGETNAKAALTQDVTLTASSPMIGSNEMKYAGTFDGKGHTLNVAYENNATEGTAPFHTVTGAKFIDLTVAGTISTSKKYAAGFVYQSQGATFTNCVSSVEITSSVNGDGTHSGFVALTQQGTTSFTNCVFDGKLLGSSTNSCGGFVGWRSGTANFTNCLFAPEQVTVSTSGCHSFCRNNPSSTDKCYYTMSFGSNSGSFVAQIFAGERVTISGTPDFTHKSKGYYKSPATLNLSYDVPEGMLFGKYSVNSGELSNHYVKDGEHVLSGFTSDVTISGSHVGNKIDIASEGKIDDIANLTYNKTPQSPKPRVTIGDTVLKEDDDYLLSWNNNTNAGVAEVVVTGIGMYEGTLTKQFVIAPRPIEDNDISITYFKLYTPTGEEVRPVPEIKYGDYTLVDTIDYDIAYYGSIEPGNYYFSVIAKGNYTGTVELPYTIMGSVDYLDYVDGNFTKAKCYDFQILRDQTRLTGGWWVVTENATINDRITCSGNVHLILMDSTKLTAPKGITVIYNDSTSIDSLTIYAQSDTTGMGKLVIKNVDSSAAGIGGTSGNSCGVIIINGGDLDVKSGYSGAAIGSGSGVYTNHGEVVVNGGTLRLLDTNSYGAAIGGGEYTDGGKITINGGVIFAKGGAHSAGIGGCDGYDGGIININGGTITATGGDRSAGIGGGSYWGSSTTNGGRSGTITITGGAITATPGSSGTVAIGAATYAKTAQEKDSISISWTDLDKDIIIANGTYSADTVMIKSVFAINGTKTLVTLDNIDNQTIVPAEWMVTFDSNGGSPVPSQALKSGDKVDEPENPTYENHSFLCWLNGNETFDFETQVYSNLELKAKWQREGGVYGDVNGDGEVTVGDVSAIYNIILGVSEDFREAADVNGDGEVTVGDVSAVYNIILGLE